MAKSAGRNVSKGPVAGATAAPTAIDAALYRSLMRHQAGAVAIIAVGRPGGRTGLAATAVTSVSDTPPTLLVCVNRNASAHKILLSEGCFAVNLLAGLHQEIVRIFSGRGGLDGEARFAGDAWTTLATGAPILRTALASLDCELVAEHGFDTHSVFIGRVRAGQASDAADPLIYFRGGFLKTSD